MIKFLTDKLLDMAAEWLLSRLFKHVLKRYWPKIKAAILINFTKVGNYFNRVKAIRTMTDKQIVMIAYSLMISVYTVIHLRLESTQDHDVLTHFSQLLCIVAICVLAMLLILVYLDIRPPTNHNSRK